MGEVKHNNRYRQARVIHTKIVSKLLGCLALITALSSWGGSSSLEAEFGDDITRNLTVGEAITIAAPDQSFLALHTLEATSFIHGGAIIVHDYGGHPDRAGVVANLRIALTQHGWQTLSVQMPVFSAGTPAWEQFRLIPDAQARLIAAIGHLKQSGISNVVLIAHGLGGKMVLKFLTSGSANEVQAAVVVGLSVTELEGDSVIADLEKIKLPLLDLFGDRDDELVIGSAAKRKVAAKKANNTDYRQLKITGADHQFSGLPSELVSRIYTWLARVAPGKKIEGRAK